MGGAMGVEPLVGRDLVGAQDGAHVIVEDLGRRTGEGLEAGLLEPRQVVGQRHLRTAGALGHLERGEAVDVDVGRGGADGLEHVEVVVTVEVRVDAALEADLGGTLRLALGDAARDLIELEQVGGAAQVEREGSLGEGTEAALERADVRVVDIAVAHVGDAVAHRPAAQVVGDLGHGAHLRAAGGEERDDLCLAHVLAERDAGEDFGHRAATADRRRRRGNGGGARGRVEQHRRRLLAAGTPPGVAGQALGVGRASRTGKRTAGSSQRSGSRAKVG